MFDPLPLAAVTAVKFNPIVGLPENNGALRSIAQSAMQYLKIFISFPQVIRLLADDIIGRRA
jgi:hypothetical protein